MSDHLSVRLTTDGNGTVVGDQGHYPGVYPERSRRRESWYSISTTTKWQFTTYERDPESGLDYAVFRYDSSRLGRFMSPDPLAGTIFNPQSLNRYAYVLNDPVNLIDPLGLSESGFDASEHGLPFGNPFRPGPLCAGGDCLDPFTGQFCETTMDCFSDEGGQVCFLVTRCGNVGPGNGSGNRPWRPILPTLSRLFSNILLPCEGFVPPVGSADIRSKFGAQEPFRDVPHKGDDYVVPIGTPVRAPFSGTVVYAGRAGNFGNLVAIEDDFGRGYSLLGHLSQVGVEPQQPVQAGDIIGRSGDTGRTRGANLHYQQHSANGPLWVFDPTQEKSISNPNTVVRPCRP